MDLIATSSAAADEIKNLVASSFAARYADLAASLETSRLAVALVEENLEEIPADLVVAAWTQYGNALRLTGRYDEAGKALAKAGAIPISDAPTTIHLLGVKASLLRNTGRYESAARLLTSAMDAQKSLGNPDGEARLYAMLGIVYLDAGNRSQAIRCFRSALDLLTPASPPDLLVSASHNLFQTLIAAGRLSAASAVLAVLEPSYRRLDSARLMAKAEWMRARLYRAMAQLPAARLAYERAYELLSTEPLSPDLAQLANEMAEFRG